MSAKWREQLRAGNINSTNKQRLLDTGILDYSKEVAGIEKGNINLSKLTGVTPKTINQTVREDLVPAIENGNLEEANNILELINHVIENATPATQISHKGRPCRIMISPFCNIAQTGLDKENKQIIRILATRHEIDELILGNRIRKEKDTSKLCLFCGTHGSPEVIIRESHDISMFSEKIKMQIKAFRAYESFEFRKVGAEYGCSVPKKIVKKIMKKWSE